MERRRDRLRAASGFLGERPDDRGGPRRRRLRSPDLPAQPHRRMDPARQRRLRPRAGKSGISPRRHAAAEGVVQGRVSRFSNVRTDRGRCYKPEISNAQAKSSGETCSMKARNLAGAIIAFLIGFGATSVTAAEIRLAEQFSMGYLQFNVMKLDKL